MSKILIDHSTSPSPSYKCSAGDPTLGISEMFSQTLQGEGIYVGQPATFLRTQGCHLGCKFCDSSLIWRVGRHFHINEVLDILKEAGTIERFQEGEHLVITGGSPLLQEDKLLLFFQMFEERFNFIPFIQVENECTIEPSQKFINYISCWNNSPKLQNSDVNRAKRYRPEVLKQMSGLPNSWFKFVVDKYEDWEEIVSLYVIPGLIRKDQIILMPKGYNQEELSKTRLMVAELAMEKNVKFSDRLQIILYNTKTGV